MWLLAIPKVILTIVVAATALGALIAFARRDRRAGSLVTLTGVFALLLFFVLDAPYFSILASSFVLIWSGGALTPH